MVRRPCIRLRILAQPFDNADNCVNLAEDRKSTRLNSSHPSISYAVFCLKKKNMSDADVLSFFFSAHPDHRALHSFPTRRSSDLLRVDLLFQSFVSRQYRMTAVARSAPFSWSGVLAYAFGSWRSRSTMPTTALILRKIGRAHV